MPKIDACEHGVLTAFEKGRLKSVATKAELARFKAAARATGIKDRRVNIRLSSGDLSDIQVRALEEGVPYQTLIASVLQKYVTGRLAECRATKQTGRPATKRHAATADGLFGVRVLRPVALSTFGGEPSPVANSFWNHCGWQSRCRGPLAARWHVGDRARARR